MNKKYQVFISSTFTDLKSERQAAVSAILKAGHIPAGMELFTSGDRSQMEVIHRWIDDSDIYMLILGGRYGSIEPTTGLSYTELEFDYAFLKKKPMFSVVINDDSLELKLKTNGSSFIEKDNPNLLKQFRAKVLENISSFFDDEKDIKLCVYESISDFGARYELDGWVKYSEVSALSIQAQRAEKIEEELNALKLNPVNRDNVRKSADKSATFRGLIEVLHATDVNLPDNIAKREEKKSLTLFELLCVNQDSLVAGVTNSPFNSANDNFLYYNVATKLKIHGLMEDKRPVGKNMNCLATSSMGNELLAFIAVTLKDIKKKNKSD